MRTTGRAAGGRGAPGGESAWCSPVFARTLYLGTGEPAPPDGEGLARNSLQPEGLRDEDGHLAARVVVERAVVAATAAADDLLRGELLDPVGERGRTGHVRERARAVRGQVARAVLRLEQEHRHLVAADRILRAVVAAAAAAGDALGGERLDPVGERRRAGHVGERAGARRRRVAEAVLAL